MLLINLDEVKAKLVSWTIRDGKTWQSEGGAQYSPRGQLRATVGDATGITRDYVFKTRKLKNTRTRK